MNPASSFVLACENKADNILKTVEEVVSRPPFISYNTIPKP